MPESVPGRCGMVSLVGAGPGDPGLLTRRGARLLQIVDLVVHDALVSPDVLALVGPDVELVHRREIDGGRQSLINAFLIREARKGRNVVRLKGGDPFVFGRGGEEAEALAQARVPFEIVPGVSSGVAVPAYAGIPVTHRALSSHVTFVTGHEDPTKGEQTSDWKARVTGGGTLVIFMGVKRLEEVIDRLLAAGVPAETPAAAIEWGTTHRQRVVVDELRSFQLRARAAEIEHPALVVVGDVVSLRTQLAWFDQRPLWRRRILVTRARSQAEGLSEALRRAGADPVLFPVLEFRASSTPERVSEAVHALERGAYDWVLFTSTNGVRFFAEHVFQLGLDLRVLAGTKLACVGPATVEALRQYGMVADVVPQRFDSEGLFETLRDRQEDWTGVRVLLLRAEVGHPLLPDSLQSIGAVLTTVPVYRTACPKTSAPSALEHVESVDTVTFTSPSSVQNLLQLLGEGGVELLRERTRIAIGRVTLGALEQIGLAGTLLATEATVEGIVATLVQDAAERPL